MTAPARVAVVEAALYGQPVLVSRHPITATVSGGANGIVSMGNSKASCRGLSNGAASGAAGLGKAGYTPPVSAGPACTVLALQELRYFTANLSGSDILLSWALTSPASVTDIRSFILQTICRSFSFYEYYNVVCFSGFDPLPVHRPRREYGRRYLLPAGMAACARGPVLFPHNCRKQKAGACLLLQPAA